MGPPTYYFLLVFSTVLYPIVCFMFLRHPARSWFHPLVIYLVFHGISFVLRPWLSIYYGYDLIYRGYHFTPDWHAKCMALIVTNLGLVVFSSVVLFIGDREIQFSETSSRNDQRERYIVPFFCVLLLVLPAFAYAIYLGWDNRMTNDIVELDKLTGHRSMVGATGYATGFFNSAPFVIGVFVWLFRFRPWALVVAAMVMLPLQGIGTRGPTIATLFVLASLYLWDKRRRWFDARALLIIFAGVLLFNFVGFDRGKAIRNLFIDDRTEIWERTNLDAPLEGMDFGNLEMVEFLTHVIPRRTGTYELFVDQLRILTEPIPRALWPDKPQGQPIRLFYLFDYGTPWGMTRSLPGEGWAQLGLLGVMIWCALWGLMLGKWYNWFATARKTPFVVTGYVLTLSILIVCYRDGLILSLLRFGLFAAAPVLVWRLFSTFRVADPAPGRPMPQTGGAVAIAVPRALRASKRGGTPRAWRGSARTGLSR